MTSLGASLAVQAASDPMHLAFASDQQYAPGLLLAVASVLRHTSRLDGSTIHIVDGGLRGGTRNSLNRMVRASGRAVQVKYHTIATIDWQGLRLMGASWLPYARLFLPALLAEQDMVLYLDCDIAFGADLNELWRMPLDGMSLAAVRDPVVACLGNDSPWLAAQDCDRTLPYFNSGVMKIDLAWWREHAVTDQALNLARREPQKCRYYDQTLLNHVLRGKVIWLDARWNWGMLPAYNSKMPDELRLAGGANIHYLSQPKPWLQHSDRTHFVWWRQLYSDLVPRIPWHMLRYRYWALFFWIERIQRAKGFTRFCRLLLVTRAYLLIPGLSRATLTAHIESRVDPS